MYRHIVRDQGRLAGWFRPSAESKWEFHFELSKYKSLGFRIHSGNRYSETPFDFHVGLWFFSLFWSINFPKSQELADWIGRGHKRDISLKFYDGAMWWKLWFDDDMGYDAYHRCNPWRKPKLWPWSAGRSKCRSWMCLRDGNIDLNPLDAIWGRRYYSYETVDAGEAFLHVNQFPGDRYLVKFELQKMTRARKFGPQWARRIEACGYVADWRSSIPFRNHSWKGDNVYGSGEKIDYPAGDWIGEALEKLKQTIIKDRQKYNYRPPILEE